MRLYRLHTVGKISTLLLTVVRVVSKKVAHFSTSEPLQRLLRYLWLANLCNLSFLIRETKL